jgi:starch phosphorylase
MERSEETWLRTQLSALPAPLRPLIELALDLRWTWSHEADGLWQRLDAGLWEETRNPWLLLHLVPSSRLSELAHDADFLADLRTQMERRRAALLRPGWFAGAHGALPGRIAYFSMEFGLHEALPLHAGGLGILAGDHLKAASDLDVPIVGVGILWQEGYFRQVIDAGGEQRELYPYNDPAMLPIRPAIGPGGDPVEVRLDLPGRVLRLRAWRARVGRVPLYLLDSNHPRNAPVDRGLTGRLYGGDPELRLLQELILGIGGWRLLEALEIEVAVCHLNEGHAAFVVLERARRFMADHGVSFREALWATRAGNLFTTHTAVAAGFDRFAPPLIEKYTAYFDAYVRGLGTTWPELLALGRLDAADATEPFSMAYLALRGSAMANAVSRLHGAVSRDLFAGLFPGRPVDEVPIGHVTNGVHVPSWASVPADMLWTAACGEAPRHPSDEDLSSALGARSDAELWSLLSRERADVVHCARKRLRNQLARHGAPADDLRVADSVLDPDTLTLGFARRFAAYKRPGLLLADRDRLRRLLTRPHRPVQLVVAGKAHPADAEGRRLVAEWIRFAAEPDVRRHVVFIEDYDILIARELVQGVDVWLNTPLRPWEASGTSGMKVLVNGGLNLSALDGWWAEAWSPDVGWALDPALDRSETAAADALYRILEEEVVPLFYDRDDEGIPRGWVERMRASMARLTARFGSGRMVGEYVEGCYLPAAADAAARTADGARLARELAAWEARVRGHWDAVGFEQVERVPLDGDRLRVTARVRLAGLPADDVRVELFAERGPGEDAHRVVPMLLEAPAAAPDGPAVFGVEIATDRPPAHFTPRIRPHHAAARLPLELPLLRWAV